jgi:hypothetical protein
MKLAQQSDRIGDIAAKINEKGDLRVPPPVSNSFAAGASSQVGKSSGQRRRSENF